MSLRVVEFALAIVLLCFAWQAAAELFIAWYSGVDPDLSVGQRIWLWARLLVLLLAAVVVLWPAPKA